MGERQCLHSRAIGFLGGFRREDIENPPQLLSLGDLGEVAPGAKEANSGKGSAICDKVGCKTLSWRGRGGLEMELGTWERNPLLRWRDGQIDEVTQSFRQQSRGQ